jgi:hypothetical protein
MLSGNISLQNVDGKYVYYSSLIKYITLPLNALYMSTFYIQCTLDCQATSTSKLIS